MDNDCLTKRRSEYAAHLVRYADTISFLTLAEVENIYKRTAAGEFDADIVRDHIATVKSGVDAPVSRGEFPCAGGPE